ncbi:iron-sulfur cluster biosynthesis family protein [Paenibacillus fonticola]|uniref:iron-sulfur cluster biosynthesis family protein n=1 Tax=Paenibacillus fonticola TaxID=379896 RepID=UPI00036F399C|nr:iron-sulfur cluster biosynthesis family protein [Paenibacillus fonticola]
MIKLEITPVAARRLEETLGEQPGIIKLYYDTEGCGCDGINTLIIQDQKGNFDVPMEAKRFSFVIDQQHQIFYEDTMWLDAEENYPSFKLSSKSATYSTNVLVRDTRHKA